VKATPDYNYLDDDENEDEDAEEFELFDEYAAADTKEKKKEYLRLKHVDEWGMQKKKAALLHGKKHHKHHYNGVDPQLN
jgi:hypothetical protein